MVIIIINASRAVTVTVGVDILDLQLQQVYNIHPSFFSRLGNKSAVSEISAELSDAQIEIDGAKN